MLRYVNDFFHVQGEDYPGLPDRGAEDRHEGAEGAGQEGVTCILDTNKVRYKLELVFCRFIRICILT